MKHRADFDVMRVLCMCSVVYLHACYASFYDLSNQPMWTISILINLFASLAVPLFFMISGALVLSPKANSSPGFVLRHRVSKLLLPLVVWSGLLLAYRWIIQADYGGVRTTLASILGTPANIAYWFLYTLIPIYLLIPALKPMVDTLDRSRWRYLLVFWLILILGIPTLRDFLPMERQVLLTPHPSLDLNGGCGYLGYFLLGTYLDRLERLPSRRFLIWSTVLGTVLVGILTFWDSYNINFWSSRFTGYLNVFSALRAAGIFLLFKSFLGQRETRSRVLLALSGCSFCV